MKILFDELIEYARWRLKDVKRLSKKDLIKVYNREDYL